MISRFLKGIAVRGAELAMGLVLVLVLFVFFMGILSISFPAGTSLTDLIGYEEASAAIPTRASLDLDLEIGEEERGERLIAMLSRVRRSVKD